MDYWTKVFLINIVVWLCVLTFDTLVLNNALDKIKVTSTLMGLWSLALIVSIPSWIIYAIATW